ncbi:hypothetical protein Peur_044347 [Populus x canadensis]
MRLTNLCYPKILEVLEMTLSLAENNLEGSFGTTLYKALASLKNLEELDLSFSIVDNSFLQTVGKITTLKSLRLNDCRLNGSIPKAQGKSDHAYLQNLEIRGNDLSGALPWCLANLTSLQQLDLSYNNFIGDISFSPRTSLTSIRELSLSDNHFKIPVSLSSFLNHSQLKYFDGRNNEIYVEELEEHNLGMPKYMFKINNAITISECQICFSCCYYYYYFIYIREDIY